MVQAKIDANNEKSAVGLLNTDGKTIVLVYADPNTHALQTSDAASGSDNGPAQAKMDSNNEPTLMGVSSTDGKTVVPLYLDSSNNLLVKST